MFDDVSIDWPDDDGSTAAEDAWHAQHEQQDALFACGAYDDDLAGLSDEQRIAYAQPTRPL